MRIRIARCFVVVPALWIVRTATALSTAVHPKLLVSPSSNNPSQPTTLCDGSPLSWSFDQLAETLGGSGKAKACWECFRLGVDPLWYYSRSDASSNEKHLSNDIEPFVIPFELSENKQTNDIRWTRQQVEDHVSEMASRGTPTKLSNDTLKKLQSAMGGGSIETSIAKLANLTTSSDGTTKMLLELKQDGMLVETVIIPWDDRQKSTVCVSSQVGCRQACTFCSTGRMGLLRSLSSAEILAQHYWANKICRLYDIYGIDNCVFMGMGEPADNADAVVRAASVMVDQSLFKLAPRRVTISTVAPNPEVFAQLGAAPVVLAWSVHSSRDELRRQLVPTTQHTMEELRQGLTTALQGRSKRLRNIMLEVTLLDQINDSTEDAEHLAQFCRPLLEEVKGLKLVVNLIPWNDISAIFGPASRYRKPQMDRVLAYQKVLIENEILSYIRTTRGDEEEAACGMLSTKSMRA
ncbi:radical SAM superfamily protein [Nitzschia inconspicua]|uniref:Radical SAM superfamily protein n=1 Tax=Nitzschia inconspicua TaxID=303405 RepID=A0A9K3KSL9_9STRA|nr:radical SAM superfamily protein [Nitzschia inconspicua]